MPDFNVRSDSVNVEQIMEQIRARIREKRGVDYTEEQIRELAGVKLEKMLDPKGIRSDLLEQFRRTQPPPPVEPYPFEASTLFDSHRGIVRFFRRLFRPLLKLFFNANALSASLHTQAIINRQTVDRLNALEQHGHLYYELLHNMVVELTRMTIEVKNAKMRVESIASRLEFNERRARALESVVVYKPADEGREPTQPSRSGGQPPRQYPEQPAPHARPSSGPPQPAVAAAPPGSEGQPGEGPGQRSRRRRRRRGRRGGASAVSIMGPGGHEQGGVVQPTGASPHREQTAAGSPESSSESQEADARSKRPEPIENAFGSATHPAEERGGTPSVPAPRPPEPPASGSPDDDQ